MPLPAILMLALVLLGGCAVPGQRAERPLDAEQAARRLYDAGDFRAAAGTYLDLAARSRSPESERLRLRAAEALVRVPDPGQAERLLGEVSVAGLPVPIRALRDVVAGRLALSQHKPQQALAVVGATYAPAVPADLRAEALLVRAQAYAATGAHLESARAHVERAALLPAAEPQAAQRLVWEQIARLPPAALGEGRTAPPDTLSGWLELAEGVRKTGTDPSARQAFLSGWRSRYPRHPATQDLIAELLDAGPVSGRAPAQIALLLPESGPFANAARAVRDGFVSAWLGTGTARPVVTVYDAGPNTVAEAYRQALADGAQFVVGPLDKESVTNLARAQVVTVPTLALNQIEDSAEVGPTGALYQFGLAPEDEARRVAERAWFDGRTRALVIYPDTEWGQRVYRGFAEAWSHMGGEILASESYAGEGSAVGPAVERLLKIDESQDRTRTLSATLGVELKAEPRRRADPDLVFMPGFARQARQVRPLLVFHRAGDLPAYATSHAYAAVPNPQLDRDLDGVVFCDMPWVVTPRTAAPELQAAVQRAWPQESAALGRLFAFGIDAYHLTAELPRLRDLRPASYQGVTGRLSLDERGRIQRELQWARFEQGQAVPLAGP
jgi:hypothetical protein